MCVPFYSGGVELDNIEERCGVKIECEIDQWDLYFTIAAPARFLKYKTTEPHRLDGPATQWEDGVEWWYLDGDAHRADGPAYSSPDGEEHWYIHGRRHREDGPAVKYSDDQMEWWLDGVRYTPKQFREEIKKRNEK